MQYNIAMDVQFGKIKPSGSCNMFTKSSPSCIGENFFTSNNNPEKQEKKAEQVGVRINDFDSNLLENSAYQDIADEMFKLEHKINLLEQTLVKVDNEISALQSLGAEIQISDLIERKKKLESELADLNNKYTQLGLSAKISGQIASAVGKKTPRKTPLSKIKKFMLKKVLGKISKKFGYKETMKEALDNLESINTSVDELINMKTPYGETVERYEKLTAYLNKANVIHSQIARNVEDISKKG